MKIEIYCKNEDDAFAFILMRAALEFRVWIFYSLFSVGCDDCFDAGNLRYTKNWAQEIAIFELF